MKKKFWTGEKLLSIAAVLVSLMTLGVFSYQTNLIRQQQFMSVYPYLSFANNFSGSLRYQFVLKNDGIGPAMVDSVLVIAPDGSRYSDLVDYVDSMVPSEDSIWYLHSNIRPGKLIPAGEEVQLIQLINDEILASFGVTDTEGLPRNDLDDSQQLFKILNHDSLQIRVIYKSIYDERWVIRNSSGGPEEYRE